jgi:hypothetical protein
MAIVCGMCVMATWLGLASFFLLFRLHQQWHGNCKCQESIFIFHWHVGSTCLHCYNEVKNSCGKQTNNHPRFRSHSHGRSKFTTFNVITSILFTFEDVKAGDWNILHIDAKQYRWPYISSTIIECIVFNLILANIKAPPLWLACHNSKSWKHYSCACHKPIIGFHKM